MANKSPNDPVALVYVKELSKFGIQQGRNVSELPPKVRVWWNERPTWIELGDYVKGFTRSQAEWILADSSMWENGAKLVIKEFEEVMGQGKTVVVKEAEAELEDEDEGEDAAAPKRRGRPPKA